MPRTAVLRTQAVEGVLEHLETTSGEAYEFIIDAAENLIGEVDPGTSYPTEFVVWKLIGKRIEDDSEEIDGAQLRRELAVLIQRASERLPVDASGEPDGALDLHEAAASLGVSVRTVQRWRDEGLSLRQIRFADGQVRLGVLQRSLDGFRDRGSTRVQRAAGFTRITSSEEDELLEKARKLMAGGASLNQAALAVAGESTRAHETVRQLIRRHRGERGPIKGVGGRVREQERTFVLRAIDRGCGISEIASRIARSPASTRRIAAEARAARLHLLRPEWIELPVFEQDDAEHVLLKAHGVIRHAAPMAATKDPVDLLGRLRAASGNPESLILPAMHLQFRVAARRIDALPRTPPVGRLDEIETELRRGDQLRRRAGESVLAAALGRVEQHLGGALEDLAPAVLASWIVFCIEVVDATLDTFDPTSRGELEPRLDRRVALETDKQIALRERGGDDRLPQEGSIDHVLDACMRLERLRAPLGLAPRLVARFDRLTKWEVELLTARYGLGVEHPHSMSDLAVRYDLSLRRIGSELRSGIHRLQGASVQD